jgi:hypothetical protein
MKIHSNDMIGASHRDHIRDKLAIPCAPCLVVALSSGRAADRNGVTRGPHGGALYFLGCHAAIQIQHLHLDFQMLARVLSRQ